MHLYSFLLCPWAKRLWEMLLYIADCAQYDLDSCIFRLILSMLLVFIRFLCEHLVFISSLFGTFMLLPFVFFLQVDMCCCRISIKYFFIFAIFLLHTMHIYLFSSVKTISSTPSPKEDNTALTFYLP